MAKITCIDRLAEPLINTNEAARHLGFASGTVRRMARDGHLPCIAFPTGARGKCMRRFRISDLEDYLETLKRRPVVSVQPNLENDITLRAG